MAKARIQFITYSVNGAEQTWPAIWCPVCKHPHVLDSRWKWNEDVDKPTFGPASPGARFSFLSYSTRPAGQYFVLKRNGVFACVPGTKTPLEFMTQDDAGQYAQQRVLENNGQGWGVVPRNRGGEKRIVYCHTYIKDGMLQVLGDTPGPLAGKTVPLPEWDVDEYRNPKKRSEE